MKKIALIFAILFVPFFLHAQTVEGLWKTIDDETGKEKSIVKVYKSGGKLYGQVVRVLDKEPGTTPKCTACEGKLKNKNIEGMTIIFGLEKNKDKWEGKDGILDPAKGKYYKCKIWLESDNKLAVRGQIGPIGRTQTWHRMR
jgi:uncharacterized protein (DUF2147 family)